MVEQYTSSKKNELWGTITTNGITSTYYPNYTYDNTTSNTGTWFGNVKLVPNREETPDEAFSKKKTITTKDGNQLELTFAEIYELKRLKKIPEEMTKDEITDVLLVLRI